MLISTGVVVTGVALGAAAAVYAATPQAPQLTKEQKQTRLQELTAEVNQINNQIRKEAMAISRLQGQKSTLIGRAISERLVSKDVRETNRAARKERETEINVALVPHEEKIAALTARLKEIKKEVKELNCPSTTMQKIYAKVAEFFGYTVEE